MSQTLELLKEKKSKLNNLLELTKKYNKMLKVDENDAVVYKQSIDIRTRIFNKIAEMDEVIKQMEFDSCEKSQVKKLEKECTKIIKEIIRIDQQTLSRMEQLRDEMGLELRKAKDSIKVHDAYGGAYSTFMSSFDTKQ